MNKFLVRAYIKDTVYEHKTGVNIYKDLETAWELLNIAKEKQEERDPNLWTRNFQTLITTRYRNLRLNINRLGEKSQISEFNIAVDSSFSGLINLDNFGNASLKLKNRNKSIPYNAINLPPEIYQVLSDSTAAIRLLTKKIVDSK
jgi:hypothetical protein